MRFTLTNLAKSIPSLNPSISNKSPSNRTRRILSQGPNELSLEHFLMRGKAMSLYRNFVRATRDIPNPDARRETIEWYRSDFERSRNEVDLEKIKDLLTQGQRQLKMMQGPMQLSGRGSEDFQPLRGSRKTS